MKWRSLGIGGHENSTGAGGMPGPVGRGIPRCAAACGRQGGQARDDRVSAALEAFELFEGAGPVGTEETRECAIGEDSSGGLAPCAVVCFVFGVAYAQNPFAAPGAGLAVATMNCHAFTKGCDFFGEAGACFGAHAVDPE